MRPILTCRDDDRDDVFVLWQNLNAERNRRIALVVANISHGLLHRVGVFATFDEAVVSNADKQYCFVLARYRVGERNHSLAYLSGINPRRLALNKRAFRLRNHLGDLAARECHVQPQAFGIEFGAVTASITSGCIRWDYPLWLLGGSDRRRDLKLYPSPKNASHF